MKTTQLQKEVAAQPGRVPAASGYVRCPECCGVGRFRRIWKQTTAQGGLREVSPCYFCMGTGRVTPLTQP